MKTPELLAERLTRSFKLVQMMLADFSDADMLARPAPGANHPAWQLTHLIQAETAMVHSVSPEQAVVLPAHFIERMSKQSSKLDDPAAFASKSELLELFTQVREASARWAQGLTTEQLEAEAPEMIRALAPTVGQMAFLMVEHTALHVGQFQVARRALGKPVVF